MPVVCERSIPRGVARCAHVEGGEAPRWRRSGEAVSRVRHSGAHHQARHVGDSHGVPWWDTQRRRSHDGASVETWSQLVQTRCQTHWHTDWRAGGKLSRLLIRNCVSVTEQVTVCHWDLHFICRLKMNCCANLFVKVNNYNYNCLALV